MSNVTIEDLDEPAWSELQMRASVNGHSVGEEARDILRSALSAETALVMNFAAAIRCRVADLGGIDIPRVPRELIRDSCL